MLTLDVVFLAPEDANDSLCGWVSFHFFDDFFGNCVVMPRTDFGGIVGIPSQRFHGRFL